MPRGISTLVVANQEPLMALIATSGTLLVPPQLGKIRVVHQYSYLTLLIAYKMKILKFLLPVTCLLVKKKHIFSSFLFSPSRICSSACVQFSHRPIEGAAVLQSHMNISEAASLSSLQPPSGWRQGRWHRSQQPPLQLLLLLDTAVLCPLSWVGPNQQLPPDAPRHQDWRLWIISV